MIRVTITLGYAAFALLCLGAQSASAAEGRCVYTQAVPQGAYEVCEMPVKDVDCAALADRPSVNHPEFLLGSCPVEGTVGTCDKGTTQIMYYSGDPARLKIGCGFQGGTWLNGYAQP